MESQPLWPSGVVPLVGGGDEEREELEAWCREFFEECEASAAGSGSDVEAFIPVPTDHPAEREARLFIDSNGDTHKSCAGQWRVKAVAAGAIIVMVTLCGWFLFKGTFSTLRQANPAVKSPAQSWQSNYGEVRKEMPPITKYENNYNFTNPLRIRPSGQRSQNYFIIIGDWGKAGGPGSCQYAVAGKLKSFVAAQKQAGKTLLFIASVGDNFYWTGVTPKAWKEDWELPYGTNNPMSPLYQVPWMAVYGNHDFGEHDPYAICPHVYPMGLINKQAYSGKQLNQDRNPSRPDSTKSFWMPDYNYHYEIPEADLEVIAVDTNGKMDPNLIAGDAKARGVTDNLCGGQSVSQSFLKAVAQAGDELVVERAKKGTASTVLIIQHYPGLCPRALFENALTPQRRAKVRLICAYGHVHSQRCDVEINGQCMDVLSGGGGGCCGPMVNLAGFTAVYLDDQGGASVDVESPQVRLAKDTCKW